MFVQTSLWMEFEPAKEGGVPNTWGTYTGAGGNANLLNSGVHHSGHDVLRSDKGLVEMGLEPPAKHICPEGMSCPKWA